MLFIKSHIFVPFAILTVLFGLQSALATPIHSPSPSPSSSSEQNKVDEIGFITNEFFLKPENIVRSFNEGKNRACIPFWTELTSATNGSMSTLAIQGKINIPEKCVEDSVRLTNPIVVKQLVEQCNNKKASQRSLASGCLFPLITFRAALIDQMTIPAPPQTEKYESLETDLLVTKFVSRFFIGNGVTDQNSDAHWKNLLDILAILSARKPQSAALAKAVVVIQFMQLRNASEKGQTLSENPLRYSLALAERLRPEDEDLRELQWALMMQNKDFVTLENDLQEFVHNQPNSKIGLYYLAGAYWRKSEPAKTKELLLKDQKLYPKDERIRNTLKRLKTAQPGEDIFSTSINLSIL